MATTNGKRSAPKKHVVIVGAGAAGMSCAATLANHPDKFKVTVIERGAVCGGQASTIALDGQKYGAEWLNDGVQGGSPAFRHTAMWFRKYGHDWHEVKLQVSFGKGTDCFWTNVFPSQLVDKHTKEIKKFGRVLTLIKYTMPVLGLVPLRVMLKMFFFSKDFGDKMVLPLIALFLGTGNQTANVNCAILERLFHDPNFKLWDFDEQTLLPNLPTMVTFPKLKDFYSDWQRDLESRGVDIRLNTDVTGIVSRSDKDGVVLQTRAFDASLNDHKGEFAPQVIRDCRGDWTSTEVKTEKYDQLVLCVLADDAKKLLGATATWRERFVLGGAKFFDDITITHSDADYFNKVYETRFKPELTARPKNEDDRARLAFAAKETETNVEGEPSGFRPMYYTHTYLEDSQKIEMSFDCTNYQHQFRLTGPGSGPPGTGGDGGDDGGGERSERGSRRPEEAYSDVKESARDPKDPGRAPVPHGQHVFQSIFLNKENSELWTMNQIAPDKVIESKWWHQLGHRWQHYVRVVPGMMFINGRNSTLFAGSWTVVNMHELACVSGIAAAYRLGAEYVVFDDFAEKFFKAYLLLSHGVRYRGGKPKQS